MINKTSILVIAVFALFLTGQAETPTIHEQWVQSYHAGSMNTPEEKISMNKTGCAHCHTAQGYWEVILKGKESTAPYKDAVGITCIACHMSEEGEGLRAGSVETACAGCHDTLVQNDEEGFSSCPQGSLITGKGGAEFEGESYSSSKHSRIEKNCAGCHMSAAPAENAIKVGGHTFRVISKGEEPRIFNRDGCIKCHKKITFEYVKKRQAKVEKLLQTLGSLLPQKEKTDPDKPWENPRLPKDPSLSKVEAMASFNYYQVLRDGTLGVHNPRYIKKLLRDSIAAFKKK